MGRENSIWNGAVYHCGDACSCSLLSYFAPQKIGSNAVVVLRNQILAENTKWVKWAFVMKKGDFLRLDAKASSPLLTRNVAQ